MTNKAKIIEQRDVKRVYDLNGIEAIIDHPKYGRLLIMDGFGGMDTIKGGAVRWEHGMIIKIKDTDTIESLLGEDYNDYMSLHNAIINGYDDSRPIIELPGYAVERIAKSTGL